MGKMLWLKCLLQAWEEATARLKSKVDDDFKPNDVERDMLDLATVAVEMKKEQQDPKKKAKKRKQGNTITLKF